jgi:quercetin dioxygenase-like cupin family protein
MSIPTITTTTDPAVFDERLRWFLGTLNRIVATADDTAGAFGLMEQWGQQGFSPPLHVHHREDSALYLIEGTITLRLGDDETTLGPGDFAFMPRDIPHTFRVDSDRARFLEIVTPGGFEQFHIDASDPAPAATLPPVGPPDIPRVVAAIATYDAELVGPPLTS